MIKRYVVSQTSVSPSQKREGIVAEVIDRTHPSDGGPVAIGSYKSLIDADQAANILNYQDTMFNVSMSVRNMSQSEITELERLIAKNSFGITKSL